MSDRVFDFLNEVAVIMAHAFAIGTFLAALLLFLALLTGVI